MKPVFVAALAVWAAFTTIGWMCAPSHNTVDNLSCRANAAEKVINAINACVSDGIDSIPRCVLDLVDDYNAGENRSVVVERFTK